MEEYANCNITVENRAQASVSGVCEVEHFNDDEVLLITQKGKLCVTGQKLRVEKLSIDSGDVRIVGQIDGLAFSAERKESFWSKLF